MSEGYDDKALHTPGTNPVQVGGSARPRPPPNRRRDKPQLSCNLCRRRKLKCNRQLPCATCTKRGLQSSCTYVTTAGPSSPISHAETAAPSNTIQDRLRRLEDLVVSLVHQDRGTSIESRQDAQAPNIAPASRAPAKALNTPPDSTVNDETVPTQPELGTLRLSDSETKYQDQSHWTSVLEAIAELKEDVGEKGHSRPPASNPDPPSSNSHIALLYRPKETSQEEILAGVPSRAVADRLIAHYFEALKLASCLIHSGEFLKRYNSFWEDPQSTPIIWVGMLFAMFAIAAQFEYNNVESAQEGREEYSTFSSATTLRPIVHEYRERVVQCLQLGRYTRGGPFVLETLIHYVGIEFALRKDASSDVWLALGITVQLAVRMGYHRDPSHFKSISPYDGEMRRRAWAMLYHMDLGISGQMGAPRLIRDSIVDTAEPRSLLDSDFNADTVELPPSRPESEATPALVVLAKIRMVSTYGVVSDLINSTQPCPYSRVMEVDSQLKEALKKVPDYCRVRPISDCIMDPAPIIIQRIYIQTTYHKARIVLHLRYLTASRDDDRYIYSQRTIIDAAIQILKFQHTIDDELKPCGRLFPARWRVSSLANHDFLLATSVICFYLQLMGNKIDPQELHTIKKIMKRTQSIWVKGSSSSTEGKKAAEAVNAALPGILDYNEDDVSQEPPAPVIPDVRSETLPGPFYQDYPAGFQMPFSLFGSVFQEPLIISADFNNPGTLNTASSFVDPWLHAYPETWDGTS
ncbi:fungal-specific transcription factor domain-containing protein [Biscogniauxia mediterranea]|nr:fungal-specific transcription factor domain-containing protein [Biscogniauxia mediterranea]